MSITIRREVRFVLSLPGAPDVVLSEEQANELAAQLRDAGSGTPSRTWGAGGRAVQWTQARKDELRQRFAAGELDAVIAQAFGTTEAAVRKQRHGMRLMRGEMPGYLRRQRQASPATGDGEGESAPVTDAAAPRSPSLADAVRTGRARGQTSGTIARYAGFPLEAVNAEYIRQSDAERQAATLAASAKGA